MSRRRESGDPHGWNSLENYLHVHHRRLNDFLLEGFVIEETLASHWLRSDRLALEGRIRCRNRLFVDVEKYLQVRDIRERTEVRTSTYSYHAGIEGPMSRTIFRYDNFHAYTREGHPDAHHKHLFDLTTWQEIPPPEWIGEAHWPHLSDVITELRRWWETTGQHLDLD